MNRKSPILQTATIACSVLTMDAVTKLLAVFLASHGYGREVLLPVQNQEFSLGVASASFPLTMILSSLGILVFGGYTIWQARHGKAPSWTPGLLIGGAVANLLDRLLFGAVHDWFYLSKVVINFADVAVVVGSIGYFVSLWQSRQAAADKGHDQLLRAPDSADAHD